MQAVVSTGTTLDIQQCLRDLGSFLDSVAPRAGCKPFEERVSQLAKGHALGYFSRVQTQLGSARGGGGGFGPLGGMTRTLIPTSSDCKLHGRGNRVWVPRSPG